MVVSSDTSKPRSPPRSLPHLILMCYPEKDIISFKYSQIAYWQSWECYYCSRTLFGLGMPHVTELDTRIQYDVYSFEQRNGVTTAIVAQRIGWIRFHHNPFAYVGFVLIFRSRAEYAMKFRWKSGWCTGWFFKCNFNLQYFEHSPILNKGQVIWGYRLLQRMISTIIWIQCFI